MTNPYYILYPPLPCKEKTIVVLGCPRGGTSVVAGALYRLGVFMGEGLGHQYEDKEFKRDYGGDLVRTVETRNREHKVWGWKLPNTIYHLTAILPHLRNPHFVVVYRDPFSIAMSSATHDGRELNQRLLDVPVNHYQKMHRVIAHTTHPRLVCSYEGLVKNKEQFVLALAGFCDLEPSAEQLRACLEFINPEKGYQVP